ncbi:phenylalanine--tRNA ligase subunit beta [Gracilimonas mengyeensis]|uniref:Phenylalanine--tRNA ligase beta subunit n=1 Tax=Gracilimonas mengyeensis TaxID=1302730 RepID=A0A521EXB0_9BACT|nr:phenylalanine--tRNA ligase subunit beta [Gracilimonas mengyeensis]SMO88536.1 phenylalanyl-tRNA synthetase beta subunit [Gracilimonas mengyeensis]
MKVSYNWLNEFIDLPLSPEETAEKLTLIGLEVEEIEEHGSTLDGVIVGEVLEVREHPNADRLQVCDVNLGDSKTQIVCGAKNVAAGQKVPVATVGSTLPVKLDDGNYLKIKKAKLRGEVSEGMICAEDELGLGHDHSGIMVLDGDLEVGVPISEVFDLYQDTIIDIAITPNRPDATCHLGVARDLAAALNLELKKPEVSEGTAVQESDDITIKIENAEKCHRYVGKMVKGVEIKESPSWLRNKLEAIGVRPVNNVVDVTNYVMFELGQPLHAFDYTTIRGKEIVVKDYDKEIEFETLDHVKRKCSPGTLFICDGEGPVAIAGVMGGVDSEVSDDTTDILIESAYFDPGSIRKTAKEQTLQTDASYRFERGIDPNVQAIAAERAAQLIAEVAGGEVAKETIDVHPTKTETHELTLRKSYVNRLLGTDFDTQTISNILDGLELVEVAKDDDTITYEIPTFRPDLEREVDLIEEVGRLFDYNKIPSPGHGIFVSSEPINDWEKLNQKIRETALQLGLREIYSNSLIAEKDAALYGDLDDMIDALNPLNKDNSTLRPSLLHGFMKAASYNFNRRTEGVRFFELGHVFNKSEEGTYYPGIGEEVHVLLGVAGLKQGDHWSHEAESYSAFDLKALLHAFLKKLNLLEHVSSKTTEDNVLEYFWGDKKIGRLFTPSEDLKQAYDFEQDAFVAELSVSQIAEALSVIPENTFKAVPKFPSFEFDFAVVIPQTVTAGELMKAIREKAGSQLEHIDIFDVFEGESLGKGNKSLAFRLNFIDPNKTLNIKEVEPIIQRIVKYLENEFSAKLRS